MTPGLRYSVTATQLKARLLRIRWRGRNLNVAGLKKKGSCILVKTDMKVVRVFLTLYEMCDYFALFSRQSPVSCTRKTKIGLTLLTLSIRGVGGGG